MKARARLLAPPVFAAALVFGGCSKPPAAASAPKSAAHDHDHDHEHDHGAAEDEGAVARFDGDHGLWLAPETVAALGVQTAAVASRPVAAKLEVTAAVFDAGPPARASALVPLAAADALLRREPRDPALLAVQRELAPALGQAELILAAPPQTTVGQTVMLALASAPRALPCVPRSAVLRTAAGTFAYVRSGEYWRRTGIETGDDDGAFVAIAAGLGDGDVVATTATESLWLTELRLTKGGGHSH